MPETRWDRLAADLKTAGYEARIDTKTFQKDSRGTRGTSCSITIKVPGKGLVTVSDLNWRKNLDKWIGWQVFAEDREGIILNGRPQARKKRSEVIADVKAAIALVGG